MRLVFWGIFSCLFVLLLIVFIILLIERKVEKNDALKFLFGVLLPIFVVSVVLLPFAYFDLSTGNYPNAPPPHEHPEQSNFKEFYGKGVNRTTYNIFRYWANNVEEHGNGEMIHKRFEVDDPAAFEEYLATVETYSGIFEDETVKTISFEKDGNVWSLVNYKSSPDIYYWYYVASGTEA